MHVPECMCIGVCVSVFVEFSRHLRVDPVCTGVTTEEDMRDRYGTAPVYPAEGRV
jgi:hypothetical protein